MDWLHVTGVHAVEWLQSTFSVSVYSICFLLAVLDILHTPVLFNLVRAICLC